MKKILLVSTFEEGEHMNDKENWILGFIEGEGSFIIDVDVRDKHPNNVKLTPRFGLKLHKREEETLNFIQNYLKDYKIKTTIHPHGESYLNLRTNGIKQSKKLAELLSNLKWRSKKEEDFKNWYKIINILNQNIWHTKKELLNVFNIMDQMHNYGHKNIKKYTELFFEELWKNDNLNNYRTCIICNKNIYPPQKKYCKECSKIAWKYRREKK